MNKQREKEIEYHRNRLKSLEAEAEREERERETLETSYQTLRSTLDTAGISFESFIRHCYRDIKKVTTKIEREKEKQSEQLQEKPARRKQTAKKRRRDVKKSAVTVKIPAGKYTNIPTAPEQIFEVKEKGPRPKLLKNYAEEIGLETLLNECRVTDLA